MLLSISLCCSLLKSKLNANMCYRCLDGEYDVTVLCVLCRHYVVEGPENSAYEG